MIHCCAPNCTVLLLPFVVSQCSQLLALFPIPNHAYYCNYYMIKIIIIIYVNIQEMIKISFQFARNKIIVVTY